MTDTYDPSATLRAGMDTFGLELGSTGSTPNPYRYGAAWGYMTDPSGLLQLGARYDWPEVGRFVSEDPAKPGGRILDSTDGDFIEVPLGDGARNSYAYVDNNPQDDTDPQGYGIFSWLRCFKCHRQIGKARRHCFREHEEMCSVRETDEKKGDVMKRVMQCIASHVDADIWSHCVRNCLGGWSWGCGNQTLRK